MQLKMQNSEEVEFCRKASRNETILVLVGEKVKESLGWGIREEEIVFFNLWLDALVIREYLRNCFSVLETMLTNYR